MLVVRNPGKFWREYKALIIFIGSVVILFTASLYFASPPDNPKTVVRYPYIVGIIPESALVGDDAVVYFDSAVKLPSYRHLNLSIINPFGAIIETLDPLVERNATVSVTYPGTYNVVLSTKPYGKLIASGEFEVSSRIEHYFAFMTGTGFPMTIGIVITGIATIYDFAFTRITDRRRKLDEKAKWTIDNSKYYMRLVRSASRVANCFFVTKNASCGRTWLYTSTYNRFVRAIVEFKNAHDDMIQNVGFYYFDDVKAEDFLGELSKYIMKMYEEIKIENLQLALTRRPASHMPINFQQNIPPLDFKNEIAEYFGPINSRDKEKLRKFYHAHLLFSYALHASINDEAIVTYSTPKHLEKTFNYWITSELECLRVSLEFFNQEIYNGNKKLNYKLALNDKDFLKRSLGMKRVIFLIIVFVLAVAIGVTLFLRFLM